MIYTTFALLREHGACESGYRKLAKHLGGINTYGRDKPIPLTVVLDSNGIDDALWCLRATTEPCDKFARLLAVAYARRVQHLVADQRSIAALDVAERYAHGQATADELAAAGAAARAAAWAAARDAAGDAAWEAALAAARAAARDAAGDAAGAAARAAAWAAAGDAAGDAARAAAWAAAGDAAWAAAWEAARARQIEIMREMLGSE